MKSASFRYISDAITKEEALVMLKEQEAGKKAREEKVKELGYIRIPSLLQDKSLICFPRYPAYVTSAGWLGAQAQVSTPDCNPIFLFP